MRVRIWLIVSISVLTSNYISLRANCSAIDSTLAANELNDVEIQLICDKEEFIQGESIDILAKIKNNTLDTLIFSLRHYIKNLDIDSTFSNQSNKYVHLPPLGKYYFMLDPTNYIAFIGIDFSSMTLKPGHYEYYLSCVLDRGEFFSNKININVSTIPDSLKEIFKELIFNPNKKYSLQVSLEQAERYEGTFYEQQFYFNLLTNSDYYYALQDKSEFNNYRAQVLELNKKFILKYPNSTLSFRLFQRIMHNYAANKKLVEEILISLKNSQPDCKLLEVLRNRPEYLNKQITHLLY
ncbi:MAG: hypothetical protein OQK56_07340 [Ignavibacteriaceae bacterium]|jgi:hypothetical protein|nr:hypothetical protein [Ignavibacteriaceae bacterium]